MLLGNGQNRSVRMKASELIALLQAIMSEDGDLPVWVFGSYNNLQKDNVYIEWRGPGDERIVIDRD